MIPRAWELFLLAVAAATFRFSGAYWACRFNLYDRRDDERP